MQAILSSPSLLRNALLVDAIGTGATGLLMAVAASLLAPLLGLPENLVFYAGLLLILFSGFVYITANGQPISRRAAMAIIILNALWVIDSIALLASGWVEPTRLGYVFVVGQALVGGAFAELQFIGIRRQA